MWDKDVTSIVIKTFSEKFSFSYRKKAREKKRDIFVTLPIHKKMRNK
jgi:hypothetical protein